ncbi:phosphate:Na+ symporter [Eubacterium ruminantium]|nr:phosphate:Na+ symporter [Eubacterium ruminantium]
MDIMSILQLLGGLGLFLYGMSLMCSSLEKLAGSGLERFLEKLTTGKSKASGRIKGWVFGTGVTAVIQSSAAVTIMISGFANAGIMKLTQAMPVVFGSNVGSTATAQILRLGDVSSDNIILQLIKPASFAPMLVGTGAFILLFGKKKKPKQIAGIIVGLGMLFYGMTLMESVFEPLRSSAKFQALFSKFSNPFLGFLAGLLITAIIQSSSAAVGILQALSATGNITYAMTIPIIIGVNVGKCMPIVLSMLGANKKARKVSFGYIFFNIFGAVVSMTAVYTIYYTVGIAFFDNTVNRGDIATIHLLFNVLISIVILPFTDKIVSAADRIIGKDEMGEQDLELSKLDDMLLNTPTIALEQCKALIIKMGEAILWNYKTATDMIYSYDAARFTELEKNENFIDKCETVLSSYIIRIDRKRLTADDKLIVSEILNSISDFERMGDHCMSIAYVAKDKNEGGFHFSPEGHREVDTMIAAVEYAVETVFTSFRQDEVKLSVRVEPLSETVKKLVDIIKANHVERLQNGQCSIEGGVYLFDLLNSFERIASHSANISLHVIKRLRKDRNFDEMHGHANDNFSEEYKALLRYYESKYIDPVLVPMAPSERERLLREGEERVNALKNKDNHEELEQISAAVSESERLRETAATSANTSDEVISESNTGLEGSDSSKPDSEQSDAEKDEKSSGKKDDKEKNIKNKNKSDKTKSDKDKNKAAVHKDEDKHSGKNGGKKNKKG